MNTVIDAPTHTVRIIAKFDGGEAKDLRAEVTSIGSGTKFVCRLGAGHGAVNRWFSIFFICNVGSDVTGVGENEYYVSRGASSDFSDSSHVPSNFFSDPEMGHEGYMLYVVPRQVLESLGADTAALLARAVLSGDADQLAETSTKQSEWVRAWESVFRLLAVSVQVQLAVADSRLVPHLSAAAAETFATEHAQLAGAGRFL